MELYNENSEKKIMTFKGTQYIAPKTASEDIKYAMLTI
jgi:hypothetical protein